MQYDMFESETIQLLRQELESTREQLAKNNRAAFREIGMLKKQIKSLQSEQEHVKQIAAKKKSKVIPFFHEYLEVSK
jgi:FtsZ-binding cell division protein ZapB